MTCSSSLSDDARPLALDTSVLINLFASACGELIINLLPNAVVIPDRVIVDLEHDRSFTHGDHDFLQSLLTQGLVEAMPMDDEAWRVYEELLLSPLALGDGEASVIAISVSRGLLPVLDDRKGRTQAKQYLGFEPAWSLDLFAHPAVRKGLGEKQFTDRLFLALREGRMRIDEERCSDVVQLIGVERALTCTSLPSYKVRREAWLADRKTILELAEAPSDLYKRWP